MSESPGRKVRVYLIDDHPEYSDDHSEYSDGDFREAMKKRAAELGIDYDSMAIGKAMDLAHARRRHKVEDTVAEQRGEV